MAKPLRIFAAPPPVAGGSWSLAGTYGLAGQGFRDHLRLRASGTGQVVAAMTGRLSVAPPLARRGLDPTDPFDAPLEPTPLPDRVTLYLQPSPFSAGALAIRNEAASLGGIEAFAYLDVATASLEAALAELLDEATLPDRSLARSQVVDLLVQGRVNVEVPAGHAIGSPAPGTGPSGTFEVGFAVLTPGGPVDPSHVYDLLRDHVEEGTASVDALLAFAPTNWPAIAATTAAEVIAAASTAIFPFSVLREARERVQLSWAHWRQVGDAQKVLHRDRLLARIGHAPPGSSATPFEFAIRDGANPFQLEAVVELYSLFDDPWASGAVPQPPPAGAAIDLLDPEGAAATAVGRVLSLDGTADLTRVTAGEDLIHLEGDVASARRWYRIVAVDPDVRQVTVDAPPNLGGTPSAWRIRLRPAIVAIDPLGGRWRGDAAARTAAATIQLDAAAKVDGIDARFDTVYLEGDLARASRAYRILAVDAGARKLTLDGDPDLGGGASGWQIPAGVGGVLPPLPYALGPAARPEPPSARLYDHYDGVAFVVHASEVWCAVRCTTFTSRDYPSGSNDLSSIRGNRRYRFVSHREPAGGRDAQYRNYALAVTDPGAAYDGVREGRFYFSQPVTADVTEPGTDPASSPTHGGLTGVRIHRGRLVSLAGGTGSAGGMVSPLYAVLRDVLIDRRLADAHDSLGFADVPLEKLRGLSSAQAEAAWLANSVDWDARITGTLWLIRPDELALG